ncbi:MAG: hypothetical protein ABSE39_04555 [Candidatus Bathyarchaeia archaeon]|jgi:hypothetical protein
MSDNPPGATPPVAPSVNTSTTSTQTSVGNPRDIQGILALVFVGGTLGIAAAAIVLGASAVTVLSEVLPLTGTIIGYYYGQKSQQ